MALTDSLDVELAMKVLLQQVRRAPKPFVNTPPKNPKSNPSDTMGQASQVQNDALR